MDDTGKIIDMASARPIEQSAWFSRLQVNRERIPLPTVANAMVILANDPQLDGLLAYDAFRAEHLIMREPPPTEDGAASLPGPYPRAPGPEDDAMVLGYFQRVWSSKFGAAAIQAAMLTAAALNRFHPVTDWLSRIRWDGKPRIDFWLTNAFDAENNRYHRAIGAKFLIAAVRRVRQAGCKFDTMLVLEGRQDIGKSRSCEALFTQEWFSDDVPADLSSKDAAMAMHGKWCLEFAEIEQLIRAEVETIKAFLSRRVDRYRPPYGRSFIEQPRQSVLIGTTNDEDYLRDSTGNRRFWPVRCRAASPDWITINREQLWAEAAQREASGETIWLEDDQVRTEALAAQTERMADDLWASAVGEWLIGKLEVRLDAVLVGALGMSVERQSRKDQNRIGKVMRQLGWAKSNLRRAGAQGKIWVAPGHDPPVSPEETGQHNMWEGEP